MDVYNARLQSFGLHSLVVDGHDVSELVKAFDEAATVTGKPTAIVARTFKGKGFPGIEDLENWHGKALGGDAEKIIKVCKRHFHRTAEICIVSFCLLHILKVM